VHLVNMYLIYFIKGGLFINNLINKGKLISVIEP